MTERTPSSLPVFDFATHPDYSEFTLAASTGRRQPLAGFDADYVDIVDYIVRCTHKIWEEKAVGLIYTHYSHNAIVHTSAGTMYGREAVVVNTLQRLAMYAARHAYADDVIWDGNEQDGFYSSHRVSSVGTNTGYSPYGPPTGRKVWRWGIADCFIKRNMIVEEWLAHDGITEVRQMGYDPVQLARETVLPNTPHTHGEIDRLPTGQQAPAFLNVPEANDDPQGFIAAMLQNMWNARLVNLVREHYTPGFLAFVPDSSQTVRPRRLRELRDYPAGLLSRSGAHDWPSVRAGRRGTRLPGGHALHLAGDARGLRAVWQTHWPPRLSDGHESPHHQRRQSGAGVDNF